MTINNLIKLDSGGMIELEEEFLQEKTKVTLGGVTFNKVLTPDQLGMIKDIRGIMNPPFSKMGKGALFQDNEGTFADITTIVGNHAEITKRYAGVAKTIGLFDYGITPTNVLYLHPMSNFEFTKSLILDIAYKIGVEIIMPPSKPVNKPEVKNK